MKRFLIHFASVPGALLLAGALLLPAQTLPLQRPNAPANHFSGQQHQTGDSSSSGSSKMFLEPQTARSQNLAAAEQEDEVSVYRHSAVVRAIGRRLHLSPEDSAQLFEYLNFAILAGAIIFLFWKYLPKIFRMRREAISEQIVEARTATEQANERLRSIEERLSRLDGEIASIRDRAERESLADEARIKAAIETEKQRIVESAGREISAATITAQRELKRFAGELAMERAVRRASITEENDRLLIRQFAQELSEENRNGGGN